MAASQSCSAAWWLWLCRQAAVWAAAMLAVGAVTRWRRGAAVSALVLAGCLGEMPLCWETCKAVRQAWMPCLVGHVLEAAGADLSKIGEASGQDFQASWRTAAARELTCVSAFGIL